MATIEEQIKALEEEILNTQKNKATEHHLGKIKAKIAKLRAQQELQKIKGGRPGQKILHQKVRRRDRGLGGLSICGQVQPSQSPHRLQVRGC